VVFLAPKVKRLHLVVRAPGLEASMSRYLIDRIAALPNVDLHTNTEVVVLEGDEPQASPRRCFVIARLGRLTPVRFDTFSCSSVRTRTPAG
jgi:hypothetical protein